jgi:p-aminobenzoyl-glutamate transporter AbgT
VAWDCRTAAAGTAAADCDDMSAWLDFLIASGSAKWTAMAPVAAPMMMLLGISPETTTAAYK